MVSYETVSTGEGDAAGSPRGSDEGRKLSVNLAERDALTGLGGMGQVINGWAAQLAPGMETLGVSHILMGPQPSASGHCMDLQLKAPPGRRVCALPAQVTGMMSLSRVGRKTGNSRELREESQGILEGPRVQSIHFLCLLCILSRKVNEPQTLLSSEYKQCLWSGVHRG